jgi:hypothetical protein
MYLDGSLEKKSEARSQEKKTKIYILDSGFSSPNSERTRWSAPTIFNLEPLNFIIGEAGRGNN